MIFKKHCGDQYNIQLMMLFWSALKGSWNHKQVTCWTLNDCSMQTTGTSLIFEEAYHQVCCQSSRGADDSIAMYNIPTLVWLSHCYFSLSCKYTIQGRLNLWKNYLNVISQSFQIRSECKCQTNITEAYSVFTKTVFSTVGFHTNSLPITIWLTHFVYGRLPEQNFLCDIINLSQP